MEPVVKSQISSPVSNKEFEGQVDTSSCMTTEKWPYRATKHKDREPVRLQTRHTVPADKDSHTIVNISDVSAVFSLSPLPDYADITRLPINFIWFGSIPPDVYLRNIKDWADNYPNRLTILWVDSMLLDRPQDTLHRIGKYLSSNAKVFDVHKNNTLGLQEYEKIHQWIFKDHARFSNDEKLKAYCFASDLYRLLIMYHGSELFDPEFKAPSGAIYFDTDIYLQEMKGIDNLFFKGVLFSHHAFQMNDIYGVSEERNIFFYQRLADMKKRIEEARHEGGFYKVVQDGDKGILALSAWKKHDDDVNKLFKEKTEFPFVIKAIGSDTSWCEEKAFKMGRSILNA